MQYFFLHEFARKGSTSNHLIDECIEIYIALIATFRAIQDLIYCTINGAINIT